MVVVLCAGSAVIVKISCCDMLGSTVWKCCCTVIEAVIAERYFTFSTRLMSSPIQYLNSILVIRILLVIVYKNKQKFQSTVILCLCVCLCSLFLLPSEALR